MSTVTRLAFAARPLRVLEPSQSNAAGALTVYVLLLLLIPPRLVVGPLGGVGTPANLFALCLLLWCAAYWLVGRRSAGKQRQPVRAVMFLFAGAVVASYAAGMLRDIPQQEVLAADRALIGLAAWLGLVLVAIYAIPDLPRLDRLLRSLVITGAAVATIGIFQFLTGVDVTQWIQIPGLTANVDYATVLQRDGFNRPSSTASHPIEFGVIMAMLLPLAVQQAFAKNRGRWRSWLPVVAIGASLPMSVSRSAILGAIVAGLFLFPTWERRRRVRAFAVVIVATGALRVIIPGLVGTLRNLFTNITEDTSTTARTGDYSAIGPYVEQAPVFGRGPGTFLPRDYRFLDNQYLMSLVETGLLGLIALVVLMLIALLSVAAARRRLVGPAQRELGQGLVAAVAVALVSFATFDALSFPTVAGLFFLLVGCCGAYCRVATEPARTASAARAAEGRPA